MLSWAQIFTLCATSPAPGFPYSLAPLRAWCVNKASRMMLPSLQHVVAARTERGVRGCAQFAWPRGASTATAMRTKTDTHAYIRGRGREREREKKRNKQTTGLSTAPSLSQAALLSLALSLTQHRLYSLSPFAPVRSPGGELGFEF